MAVEGYEKRGCDEYVVGYDGICNEFKGNMTGDGFAGMELYFQDLSFLFFSLRLFRKIV